MNIAETAWNADLRSAQRAEGPRATRHSSSRATEVREHLLRPVAPTERTVPQVGAVRCAVAQRVPTRGRRSKPAAPTRRSADPPDCIFTATCRRSTAVRASGGLPSHPKRAACALVASGRRGRGVRAMDTRLGADGTGGPGAPLPGGGGARAARSRGVRGGTGGVRPVREADPDRSLSRPGHGTPGVRQRVLDLEAAGGPFAPRDLLPRLLQAAVAAVFHHPADPARRTRPRPVHGPGHHPARSCPARPPRGRFRPQPAERAASRAPFRPAGTRGGGGAPGVVRSGALPGAAGGSPDLLPPGDPPADRQPPGRAAGAPERRTDGPGGPLDPDGGDQPAHRALAGVLFGVHAPPQPGGVGPVAAPDQRAPEPGAAGAGRPGAHPPEDPLAAGPSGTRRPGAALGRRRPVAHRLRRPDSGDRRRERAARRDLAALSRRGELPGRQLAAVLVQRGGWG